MTPSEGSPSTPSLIVANNLVIDLETSQVAEKLADHSVPFILLKGPSVSSWLYSVGQRPYGDIDLLVETSDVERVGSILRTLGYARRVDVPVARLDPTDRPPYAFSWRKGDLLIELHQTLVGIGATPERAWSLLSAGTDEIRLEGTRVPILSEAARTLHLALHAAQHGRAVEKSIEDLRRGLTRLEVSVWTAAHALSKELDAEAAFLNGLALLPEGEQIVAQLGAVVPRSLDVELHAAHARSSARSIEWFRSLSPSKRIRWVARKVVPPASFMRVWHPLARSGGPGLMLAYLWRPLWLVKELALGLLDRRRVRRRLGDKDR